MESRCDIPAAAGLHCLFARAGGRCQQLVAGRSRRIGGVPFRGSLDEAAEWIIVALMSGGFAAFLR
jgi:hypothetical protein